MTKLFKLIFSLLLISTPLFFIYHRDIYVYFSIYGRAKEALAQGLILVLFSVWPFRGNLRLNKNPLNLPLLTLISFMAVSSFWAINPYQSLIFLKRWACHILLFFIIANNVKPKEIGAYTAIIVFTAVAVSLYGIAQKLGFEFPFIMHPTLNFPMQAVNLNSTTGNPNFAGAYIAGIIPLALFRQNKKWLFYSLAGVMFAYLIIIGTRSAWVGLIAAMVIMCSRVSRRNRITLLIILITGITAALLSPPSRQRFISIFNTTYGTNRQRVEIWKGTVSMIKDKPFLGVGIGNFSFSYPRYQTKEALVSYDGSAHFIRQAHNEHLQLGSEIGLIGFAVFMWFVIALMWSLWRGGRIGLLGSVVATLVTAGFSFNLQNEVSALSFWAIAGMGVLNGSR